MTISRLSFSSHSCKVGSHKGFSLVFNVSRCAVLGKCCFYYYTRRLLFRGQCLSNSSTKHFLKPVDWQWCRRRSLSQHTTNTLHEVMRICPLTSIEVVGPPLSGSLSGSCLPVHRSYPPIILICLFCLCIHLTAPCSMIFTRPEKPETLSIPSQVAKQLCRPFIPVTGFGHEIFL